MTHRGTTNKNDRGSTRDRARRRAYLLATYAADYSIVHIWGENDLESIEPTWVERYPGDGSSFVQMQEQLGRKAIAFPSCRCYRCGVLLTESTMTVDRIIPGVHGGTYRRTNIRPACGYCNSETGSRIRRK